MNTSSVSPVVASQILTSCTDDEGYVDYEAYDMMMAQEEAANQETSMNRIAELKVRIANLKAKPCRWSPMLLESAEAELKLEERHAFGMAIAYVAFAMLQSASPEQLEAWNKEC